eukprot:jgi/Mesen1/10954/ME000096S10536
MGAADSKEASSKVGGGGILKVSSGPAEAAKTIDPCLEKLQSLRLSVPLLGPGVAPRARDGAPGGGPSGADLARRLGLAPEAAAELVQLYQAWQDAAHARMGHNQEELHARLEAVEALAMKVVQRLNFAASAMKSSAAHLQQGTL